MTVAIVVISTFAEVGIVGYRSRRQALVVMTFVGSRFWFLAKRGGSGSA